MGFVVTSSVVRIDGHVARGQIASPSAVRHFPTMHTAAFLSLTLLGSACGLTVQPQSARAASSAHMGRRAAVTGLGSAVLAAAAAPAFADTQPMLDKPMEGFDAAADKRAAFIKKQKEFKKEWRKQLSNLEFCSNDEEALDAITKLRKLIVLNGNEIPEGVRKQDLDQVRGPRALATPRPSARAILIRAPSFC